MYTTDYFVRFINTTENAQRDLDRGHSFYGYMFYSGHEAAMNSDLIEYGSVVEDDIVEVEINNTIVFGFALSGLSGFGPFETLDEAIERGKEGFGGFTHAAIYIGRMTEVDPDGVGELFRPETLEIVVEVK